jgi:hypothetical protein
LLRLAAALLEYIDTGGFWGEFSEAGGGGGCEELVGLYFEGRLEIKSSDESYDEVKQGGFVEVDGQACSEE